MTTLTPQQIFSIFDMAERDLPVSNWEIGGLKVWPLIRNYHAYWLCAHKALTQNNEIANHNENVSSRIGSVVKNSLNRFKSEVIDREKNDKVRKTDILIAAHTSTRYFKVDGAWYNPYSDSLAHHFGNAGIDSLVLEFTAEGNYLIPRFAPSILVQQKSLQISLFAKFAGKIGWPVISETLEGWGDFLALIERNLGPDCLPSLDSMRFRARQVLGYEAWFNEVIRVARPSVGIVTGYYSSDMMGFIRACRRAGILTIEIQHGVQGSQHFAYRQWAQLPVQGYDTMPEIFWSWSESEKANIDSWTQTRTAVHRAVVGGNPCLHIYDLSGKPYTHSESKPNLEGVDRGKDYALNIIYTAQAFNEIPACLLGAIRQTPHWKWWIRTHPQYLEAAKSIRNICVDHGFSNVDIDRASELPLVSLLDLCDVHVTEFSSSVLEATSRGVPSVVINPIGVNIFQNHVDTGIVVFADTVDSLLHAIESQSEKKNTEKASTCDTECFFPEILVEIRRKVSEHKSN
ncbi:MAG: glycosyltransferase [Gallionellaceae bacterium]